MDSAEALALARAAAPQFAAAGLPRTAAHDISSVEPRSVARLWAGMGSVVELKVSAPTPLAIIAKRVAWSAASADTLAIGDRRKRDSYVVEANFYGNGHAERLHRAGCRLPRAITAQHRPDGITIVMSKVQGERAHLGRAESCAVLTWLARMHAEYWGARADAAVAPTAEGGLQAQGCYWYLDTRPDEHEAMPTRGWEGRLRRAARVIDLRLKADPLQTICHGDAKDANMVFAVCLCGVYTFTSVRLRLSVCQTHTRARARTHRHTQTHTDTHTHTHARTHTRTH